MRLFLKEIAGAVNGTLAEGCADIEISGISTDTREDLSGKLFVAIRGERFDGNNFLAEAFENGAAACLAEKEGAGPMIIVEDAKKALLDLARYYRRKFSVPIVAVTGSTGKTTTKDMLHSVLSQRYKTLKTEGNFNNEIGLPLTIFRLEESHEAAVLEMGMNHFGEIRNLSYVAEPDIALITNIGVSHIENLGSREGILRAKMEIQDFMKKDGTLVLNYADELLKEMPESGMKTLWYGKDISAKDVVLDGLRGVRFTLCHGASEFPVIVPQPGAHMVLNALAAAAVGFILGLTDDEIRRGLENFKPAGMRFSVLEKRGLTIINDAYNANPASVKASVDVLETVAGRKVCILGDMLELGNFSRKMHEEIGIYVSRKKIDLLVCIGQNSYYTHKKARGSLYFKTKEEFLFKSNEILREGDTVLLKASRGMKFEKIIEAVTR